MATKILVYGTGTIFRLNDDSGYHAVNCRVNEMEFCKANCSYCVIRRIGNHISFVDCDKVYMIAVENFTDMREIENKINSRKKDYKPIKKVVL